MADDILERLRHERCDTGQCHLCPLIRAAADEIERLRAENARLHRYVATVDAYFHEHGWESLALLEARRAIADQRPSSL